MNVKIVKTETIENSTGIQYVVTYNIPGYGIAQPFYYDANTNYVKERKINSGIPKEFAYKFGKNFNWSYYTDGMEFQKKIVNKFIIQYEKFKQAGKGLYIYSKTSGSGKTMLACCLANEVIERYGTVVKFCSVTDYLNLVIEKSSEAKEQIESFRNCGLLVLDDIGVQTEKKEWVSTALFDLIDERYRNLRPTIYTSNLESEIASSNERLNDRIYSSTVPIVLPEVSVRKELADKELREFMQSLRKE